MVPPPARILPVLQKLKEVYLLWFIYYQNIPKTHRYTLGTKVDSLFVETIEGTSVASFLSKKEKLPWIQFSIRKLDTLKVLLMILWETKTIDNKKYIALSVKVDEVGRMLGGWRGQLTKNSPEA
jgi:hypothetical protein